MMPLQLTIRRAQPADIPQIVAVERIAFNDPWDERTLRESLAFYPETFFVAKDNGEIAGFVAGGVEDTGEEVYGHIMNLAVAPEYRRRGIGSATPGRRSSTAASDTGKSSRSPATTRTTKTRSS